jgi:hypothetical protein
MRRFIGLVLASGALLSISAVPAAAVPIVDQSFTTPDNLAESIRGPGYYVAQTFTAGITGNLTGVNIDVNGLSAPPLRVVIRTAPDGKPSGKALAIRYLPRDGQFPLSRLITFNGPIPVTAGMQYAIQLNYAGVTGGGSWDGARGNVYAGGWELWHAPAAQPYWLVNPDEDLHFRTYVDPA